MAMSRNARRLASKLRNARREADAANSAEVLARRNIVNRNLSRPIRGGKSNGMVSSVYTGCAKSLGFSHRKSVSRGEAPLGKPQRGDWAIRGNQLRD